MRVILVGYRRAEQSENSVARGLDYVAAIAVHRLDHEMQRRIDKRARRFRIELLHQVHRSLDIGE